MSDGEPEDKEVQNDSSSSSSSSDDEEEEEAAATVSGGQADVKKDDSSSSDDEEEEEAAAATVSGGQAEVKKDDSSSSDDEEEEEEEEEAAATVSGGQAEVKKDDSSSSDEEEEVLAVVVGEYLNLQDSNRVSDDDAANADDLNQMSSKRQLPKLSPQPISVNPITTALERAAEAFPKTLVQNDDNVGSDGKAKEAAATGILSDVKATVKKDNDSSSSSDGEEQQAASVPDAQVVIENEDDRSSSDEEEEQEAPAATAPDDKALLQTDKESSDNQASVKQDKGSSSSDEEEAATAVPGAKAESKKDNGHRIDDEEVEEDEVAAGNRMVPQTSVLTNGTGSDSAPKVQALSKNNMNKRAEAAIAVALFSAQKKAQHSLKTVALLKDGPAAEVSMENNMKRPCSNDDDSSHSIAELPSSKRTKTQAEPLSTVLSQVVKTVPHTPPNSGHVHSRLASPEIPGSSNSKLVSKLSSPPGSKSATPGGSPAGTKRSREGGSVLGLKLLPDLSPAPKAKQHVDDSPLIRISLHGTERRVSVGSPNATQSNFSLLQVNHIAHNSKAESDSDEDSDDDSDNEVTDTLAQIEACQFHEWYTYLI